MKQNKPLNDNKIDEEKKKLQQEIKRLEIYKNCNEYKLDQLLWYFPNRATEIKECFREEGKNVLSQDKKRQLQEIIMEELCSLLYPCIKKGYTVLPLDKSFYWQTFEHSIYLNAPDNNNNISILIGRIYKIVSTNATIRKDDDGKRCSHNSGIWIKYCVGIIIYNRDMNYKLIIHPETKDIKLTDYDDRIKPTTFCDQNDEIFKNKEDTISFFSTLSFAEIEQVLQILNKHLKDKKYYEVDIGTVLNEIKNTIEEKRNAKTKPEIEKEDETSSNCCITCLKQCWPFSKKEK